MIILECVTNDDCPIPGTECTAAKTCKGNVEFALFNYKII